MQQCRICTRESNDVGKRVDFAHRVAAANTWRTQRPRGASGFRAAAQHSKEVRPKDYQGIIRCRAGVGKQGRHRGDGKPAGPDRPLEKGVSAEEVRLDDPRI